MKATGGKERFRRRVAYAAKQEEVRKWNGEDKWKEIYSQGPRRGLHVWLKGSSGCWRPLGEELTSCCCLPVVWASAYQKKCSQLGGKKIKQNRNLTIAGVSLQGLREIVRSCLLQLQSLPLVCKYPAVLSLTPSLLSRTHTHFKSIAAHSLPASATSEGCPIYIVAWGVKHFRVHAQADMLSRWKRLSFHTLPVFEAFPSQAMKWDIVWCQTFSLCECVTEAAAWCNHIVLCFYIQICKCALAGRCESVTWKMLFSSLIQDC